MPDPEVITAMRRHKAALLRQERVQMTQMARRWMGVENRLKEQMDDLAQEMASIKRRGGFISKEMLINQQRYRLLMAQLQGELVQYTNYAERTIADRQRQLAIMGADNAVQAIQLQGVTADFNRLPIEAIENIAGSMSGGSPLRSLLTRSWPLSADALTQELINGIALGYNPRKVARLMAQGATKSLDRMMVIARTEQLRSYRTANLDSYRASGVVNSYQRLATHDSRVCAACLMDEGHIYELEENMPEHPQGRCTCIPVIEGLKPPAWQHGRDWFMEQPEPVQVSILGKGTFDAWQHGAFDLRDLVTVKRNQTWGDSLQVTPLKELVG